jgi:uncharacterized Zn-binding protein involved in type VI secretion
MATTIGINPPKTPVTEGSQDKAPASLPNVCKMPGPPAPFVPTPLPNFGRSEDSIADYTTTVLFEGKKVAIKGATYKSTGSPDAASKATGGGIVSSVEEGKTGFAAPGSMNVKAEGKNIQLLGDAMTNNGSNPYNAATVPGNLQGPALPKQIQAIADALCDEFCNELKNNKKAKRGNSSHRLEKRLKKEGKLDKKGVKFPRDATKRVLGKLTIPDAALVVGGNVTQCFDFKFPGDRWRGTQRIRQRRMAQPNKDPIEISQKTCGC